MEEKDWLTRLGLEAWEKPLVVGGTVVLVVLVVLEFFCGCLTSSFPILFSVLTGMATGLVSAVAVVLFGRRHRKADLETFYAQFAGTYYRTAIGQDNTPTEGQVHIRKDNVTDPPLRMVVRYSPDVGEHCFALSVEYWKSMDCHASGYVEFTDSSRMVATGTYAYDRGKYKGTLGRYVIHRFELEPGKLLMLYQHVYPRDIADNPDANRGWEIWERQPLETAPPTTVDL